MTDQRGVWRVFVLLVCMSVTTAHAQSAAGAATMQSTCTKIDSKFTKPSVAAA